jgi:3-hydroxyacyl-[acyl-carrier-protein] dehydratase
MSTVLPKPIDILPQKPPFLFVDEYLELDEQHCLAKYTFKEDEWFFKGHFPGNPIVPGVILIEAMGQIVVSLGIFIVGKKGNIPLEKVKEKGLIVFSHISDFDFLGMVKPKDTIYIAVKVKFFRFYRIEGEGEIYKLVNGEKQIVCKNSSLVGQKAKQFGT